MASDVVPPDPTLMSGNEAWGETYESLPGLDSTSPSAP